MYEVKLTTFSLTFSEDEYKLYIFVHETGQVLKIKTSKYIISVISVLTGFTVWLNLGTKLTLLGLGKHHGLG